VAADQGMCKTLVAPRTDISCFTAVVGHDIVQLACHKKHVPRSGFGPLPVSPVLPCQELEGMKCVDPGNQIVVVFVVLKMSWVAHFRIGNSDCAAVHRCALELPRRCVVGFVATPKRRPLRDGNETDRHSSLTI
jgi:hypothetical protein